MMLRKITSSIFCASSKSQLPLSVRFQSTIDYSHDCDGLLVEPKDKVLWLKFNRPNKYNAITKEMYHHITETFNKANNDDSIKTIVLTGVGEYYSSGNDLTNFSRAIQHEGGLRAGMTESKEVLLRFVESLINLKKLLIAAVNGPALGIAVTTLPLCDYTIASSKSTFSTPFTALGQCPEACSSVTFPSIMGPSRANELLLLNQSWDAKRAHSYGLISEVIEHDKFHAHLDNLLYGKSGVVDSCYPNSLMVSKSLSRDPSTKQRLLEANQRECDNIVELWCGPECADAVQKFFKRSKK